MCAFFFVFSFFFFFKREPPPTLSKKFPAGTHSQAGSKIFYNERQTECVLLLHGFNKQKRLILSKIYLMLQLLYSYKEVIVFGRANVYRKNSCRWAAAAAIALIAIEPAIKAPLFKTAWRRG